jgi:hypothetical protein
MYTTIRSYGGGDAFTDALLEHQDAISQVIPPIGGFRGYYVIRGEDGPVTISVFEDQAGAEESVRAAAAWVSENLADVSPGPPTITSGEVVVSFQPSEATVS